jgi:phosphoribosylformylglycinamidine synthase subunit PurS
MTGPADLRLDTLGDMAAYAVHVEVSHRPGIADPAGATVERALPALGYTNVTQVHIGKVIRLVVDAADADAARAQAEEMCERLLANPVIESYEVTVAALEPAP